MLMQSICIFTKINLHMGKKGDKLTNDTTLVAEELLNKLNAIPGITSKKMFGGYGVFHQGKMFGIIDSKGMPFLKVDDSTLPDFELYKSEKHSRMPYYSIPDEVLSYPKTLISWVQKSIIASK